MNICSLSDAALALDGHIAVEVALCTRPGGANRLISLKEVGDRELNNAPTQSIKLCYVVTNISVLTAFHVENPGRRARPYIKICHLYVARGEREKRYATVLLAMIREYAINRGVCEICLGQGLRENIETVDFWVNKMGFKVDEVKSMRDAPIIMDESVNVLDFGRGVELVNIIGNGYCHAAAYLE